MTIITNRTVRIRCTVSSIPFGTLRTGSRLINTTKPIEELPRQTFILGIRADALGSIVVGVRWARYLHTAKSIPSLILWAGGITTDLLAGEPHQSQGTLAFSCEGRKHLALLADGNQNTDSVHSFVETIRADTSHGGSIIDFPIGAEIFRFHTFAIDELEIKGASTFPLHVIP